MPCARMLSGRACTHGARGLVAGRLHGVRAQVMSPLSRSHDDCILVRTPQRETLWTRCIGDKGRRFGFLLYIFPHLGRKLVFGRFHYVGPAMFSCNGFLIFFLLGCVFNKIWGVHWYHPSNALEAPKRMLARPRCPFTAQSGAWVLASASALRTGAQ